MENGELTSASSTKSIGAPRRVTTKEVYRGEVEMTKTISKKARLPVVRRALQH